MNMYDGNNGSFAEGYAIGRDSSNNYNGGFGGFGDNGWWIILLFMFGWGGFGGNGWGNNGSSAQSVRDGYVLTSDFANIERKIDSVADNAANNFCSTNQNLATGFGTLTDQLHQGFSNATAQVTQQQFDLQSGINNVATQLQSCCCENRQNMSDLKYDLAQQNNGIQTSLLTATNGLQNAFNAGSNALTNAVNNGFCNTNYNMATMNNQTLQAIDKVGDRVIDYMANREAQALRDENQALRLAASQAAQTNSIVDQLRPAPIPAYTVQNPYAYNGCGCNTGCGCGM